MLLDPILLWACSIPVFRYALEYWPADSYEVIVFHRGDFALEEQNVVDWLEKCGSGKLPYSNFKPYSVDLAAQPDEGMLELWKAQPRPELPWMVVRYPRSLRIKEKVWAGPLSEGAANALLNSPLREKILRLILNGESAVWVLLESGTEEKDDAAARVLQSQLRKMEETLELPEPAGDLGDAAVGGGDSQELRISFSLLRLSRTDPREAMLISMLLHSEGDLKTFSNPMAFPIFGRGRILYALVGDGINEENIREACTFLTGGDLCQVKDQNPGTDLLMSVTWDERIQGRVVEEPGLPSLSGLSEFVSVAVSDSKRTASLSEANMENVSDILLRNILLAVVLGLVISAGATFILKRKKQRFGN